MGEFTACTLCAGHYPGASDRVVNQLKSQLSGSLCCRERRQGEQRRSSGGESKEEEEQGEARAWKSNALGDGAVRKGSLRRRRCAERGLTEGADAALLAAAGRGVQ